MTLSTGSDCLVFYIQQTVVQRNIVVIIRATAKYFVRSSSNPQNYKTSQDCMVLVIALHIRGHVSPDNLEAHYPKRLLMRKSRGGRSVVDWQAAALASQRITDCLPIRPRKTL